MKLIIDIPKEYYEALKEMSDENLSIIDRAIIRYGTPLPEHHGDLIDRDKLKRTIVKDPRRALSLVDLADFVWLAPTIIEGSDSE